MVIFNEEEHTYTSEDGSLYTSTTTLLGKYKRPFDSEFHALNVARRMGVDIQCVLDDWEEGKNKACAKGTAIHKIMEDYIIGNEEGIDEKYDILYRTYDRAASDVGIKLSTLKQKQSKAYKVTAEKVLFDDEYKLAGMADIIYDLPKNEFIIGDFKTNKRFDFTNKYGEFLLEPIGHLHNCAFNTYALQLSIYSLMYEKLSGRKCAGMVIYYLEPNGWKPIRLNYMKCEAESILKHHNNC